MLPNTTAVLRRASVMLFCAGYLGLTALFGARHMLGDLASHSASYFFTWDMFPGYTTETSRRQMIGETASGRFVELLPAANHHFLWGINHKVRRIDVDRSEANYRPELGRQVRRYLKQHPDDRIVKIYVVERYWPSKYNLPDDIYQAAYGEPNPRRKYRRVIGTAAVTAEGEFRDAVTPGEQR